MNQYYIKFCMNLYYAFFYSWSCVSWHLNCVSYLKCAQTKFRGHVELHYSKRVRNISSTLFHG